jgi:hypothetical protein
MVLAFCQSLGTALLIVESMENGPPIGLLITERPLPNQQGNGNGFATAWMAVLPKQKMMIPSIPSFSALLTSEESAAISSSYSDSIDSGPFLTLQY